MRSRRCLIREFRVGSQGFGVGICFCCCCCCCCRWLWLGFSFQRGRWVYYVKYRLYHWCVLFRVAQWGRKPWMKEKKRKKERKKGRWERREDDCLSGQGRAWNNKKKKKRTKRWKINAQRKRNENRKTKKKERGSSSALDFIGRVWFSRIVFVCLFFCHRRDVLLFCFVFHS